MELLSLHLQDTTSFREGQVLPHLQDFFPFGLKRATLLEADTPSIHTSTMSKKKKSLFLQKYLVRTEKFVVTWVCFTSP
jgi:hypothetical protein